MFLELVFILIETNTEYSFPGQKHSRLARLERVAMLVVSSCSPVPFILRWRRIVFRVGFTVIRTYTIRPLPRSET